MRQTGIRDPLKGQEDRPDQQLGKFNKEDINMAKSTIEKRRRLRELEAARDKELGQLKKSRAKLATVRAEIKHTRGQ
jgi:hypothetical protein